MDPEAMLLNIRNIVRNDVVNIDLISMPFHQDPDFCKSVEALPKQLRQLFTKLFNQKKEKLQLKTLLSFKPKISTSPTCHKLLNPRVQSYRCFDCQIHIQSLLCQECFKNGNHTRHRFSIVKDQGNCDCGCKEIIKQQGFCNQHRGEQEIVEINSNEEFLFNLYIRQLFIWILKLFKHEHKNEGELFLLHFINYLAFLNEKSIYYNTLTTRLLFSEIDPIADHIYYLSINSSDKFKIVNATVNLYYHILGLREFKERLLVSLLTNYNKVENIQTSRFIKLTNSLFSEAQVVISVMKKHPIALRPQRKFSIQAYFGLIGMISTLTHAEAARALITPLLMVDSIKFPFLEQIEQRCEKDNSLIVQVFPMFINEETFYYEHVTHIVKLIENKNVLAAMMRNYYRMARGFSFKKNKIILVPQRIVVLVIYKYYDFDLSRIDKEELANIMELTSAQLQEFLFNTCKKFAECLFEFSMNLNRTTYLENYLPLYAKQGQIICIDQLGVRMLSPILGSKAMQAIMEHIYRQDLVKYSPQERSDFFKAGNIFLKIIIEIITSPRTQMLISAKLGNQDKQSIYFYKQFFQKIGQVTKEELNIISLVFSNSQMINKDIIQHTLSFDTSKKKLTVKASSEKSEDIHLQFMVSLLPTKLSKFVQKKSEAEDKCMHLNDFDQGLKEILLSCDSLQRVVKNQLLLINNNQDYKLLIRDLINVIKSIKVAYYKQLSEYNRIYYVILEIIHLKYVNSNKEEQQQNNQFLQEMYQIINTQKNIEKKQQSTSKESQRRKELLKLKKQKMMKSKKIKQNQQLFLSKQNKTSQKQEQMCLICRQSNKNDEMCYVAKMRYTNLLFDFMKIKENNIVFKSCFHTVHFECFNKINKPHEETTCPLCKCAINIVLPIQNTYHFQLYEKVYKRIELVLSYFSMNLECQGKKEFICEALCYFVYMLLANLEELDQISPKQCKLMKIVFGLVEHSMNLQNNIERRAEKADDNLSFFVDSLKKVETAESELYIKLILLIYSRSKWNKYLFEEEQLARGLIQSLSQHLPVQTIQKITKIIQFHDHQRFNNFSHDFESIQQTQPPIRVSFLRFWVPPKTLDQLFQLRDRCSKSCKISHQICICITCQKQYCLTCKKVASHCRQTHSRESLFFNTYTGGLYYFYRGLELSISCFYLNEFLKIWKPQYPIDNFTFNFKLYQQVLSQLTNGNLFSYLINNFQGLKGGQVADRI